MLPAKRHTFTTQSKAGTNAKHMTHLCVARSYFFPEMVKWVFQAGPAWACLGMTGLTGPEAHAA